MNIKKKQPLDEGHNKQVKTYFNNTNNYLNNNANIALRKYIIQSLIGQPVNSSILDIGCGNGELSLQYSKHNKLDYLDISENMINIVKSNLNQNQLKANNLIVGEVLSYDFNKRYDIILCVGVLAHVSSVNSVINKTKNLLKEDGCIIFQFTNYSNIMGKILIGYYKMVASHPNSNLKHSLNKITLKHFINQIELNNLEIDGVYSYLSLLPGMGRLSKSIRLEYQTKTLKNGFSFFGSEIFIKVVSTKKEKN